MAATRYEIRVNGTLSERARAAFCALDVMPVPTQTIVFGELAEQSDLRDLLALCSAMGLQVVSLRRVPADAPATQGGTCADEAGSRFRNDRDASSHQGDRRGAPL